MDDTRALKVSTTTDTVELAGQLAQSALAANLAGGAEVIGPIDAHSWHDGQAVQQPEWRVTFTTTTAGYPALEAHLRTGHAWRNPEITAVAVVAASQDYLAWLERTVTSP